MAGRPALMRDIRRQFVARLAANATTEQSGLCDSGRVGRVSVAHLNEDEQLAERQAREHHADADAGCHESKFGDYGHAA